MQEMGFRKDAPDSVKEAFIKHLVYASTGVRFDQIQGENKEKNLKYTYEKEPEQLTFFDLEKKKAI